MTSCNCPPPALILVCKRPALGHGKQRLAAQLGPAPTLAVAERLLDCALEDLAHWPGPRVIAPDADRDDAWAATLLPGALCLPQTEGNLGERLNLLDHQLRDDGHPVLLFMGSDAPALDDLHYRRIRAALEETDTALITARDGGVVLMGSRLPWPELADLPWSTPQLGEALAERCREAGHAVKVCGACFDVDEPADLRLAQLTLEGDPRPARRRLLATLGALSEAHA